MLLVTSIVLLVTSMVFFCFFFWSGSENSAETQPSHKGDDSQSHAPSPVTRPEIMIFPWFSMLSPWYSHGCAWRCSPCFSWLSWRDPSYSPVPEKWSNSQLPNGAEKIRSAPFNCCCETTLLQVPIIRGPKSVNYQNPYFRRPYCHAILLIGFWSLTILWMVAKSCITKRMVETPWIMGCVPPINWCRISLTHYKVFV